MHRGVYTILWLSAQSILWSGAGADSSYTSTTHSKFSGRGPLRPRKTKGLNCAMIVSGGCGILTEMWCMSCALWHDDDDPEVWPGRHNGQPTTACLLIKGSPCVHSVAFSSRLERVDSIKGDRWGS